MSPPYDEPGVHFASFETLRDLLQQTRRQKLAPFGSVETGRSEGRLEGDQSVESVEKLLQGKYTRLLTSLSR